MYLGQTINPEPTIKALSDAGVQGILLVVLIAVVCGFVLAWLVLRSRTKKTDSDAVVMVALTNMAGTLTTNITKLTDNQIEMQTGARKRDEQVNLFIKAADEQNELLTGIKQAQESGNEYWPKIHRAFVDGLNDTSTAFTAIGEDLSGKVGRTEASILAKIDGQTDRIAGKVLDSHAALKQTIVERTKSIEDLFVRITNDNEDLATKLELRDATIGSLQARLTEAETELKRLKQPPPDPTPPTTLNIVDGDTGDVLKEAA